MFKNIAAGGLLALAVFASHTATAQTPPSAPASAVYVPAATLPISHWAYGSLNRVWAAASGSPVTETATARPRTDLARATVQIVRRLAASDASVQARLGAGDKQALASLVGEFGPEIAALRTDTKALTASLARMGVAVQLPAAPLRDTPFADVPNDHWAFESVEKVRKAGVVQGYPGGQGGTAQASKARVATTTAPAPPKPK